MALIDALLALEHAAAVVESFLPVDATTAELAELLAGWAPPVRRINTVRSRQLQAEDFVRWIRDCGERWEARPPAHPTGEQMAALVLAWARGAK
jgi:hypothetical protein